ncbi:EF-hand domain-containing protein [Sphingomonas sp. DG1-23]|uniref:EF-hand domain-containing protein n=1 Tax=Sphingomonas sp. DG1-23 TaxID=3068316 RepID=UPI00273E3DC3|nr:EF-hand domain-containing protein [Sphingomonas sp. DG1-23]MDP5278340.1 EF-hand domain-containing protein [Sphingomonas sp. DG1-23]
MKKTLAAALLGATLVAGSAVAAPQDRDPLARADADNDGTVTKAEFLADVDARFAKLDANKDGKISKEERPGDGERRGRMMNRIDTNNDGAISLDEQHAQADRRFARLDTNGDGKIDKVEGAAARERMRGAMERRDAN